MQQFFTALRMIPAAGRYFGGLLMSLMLVLVLARLLKIPPPYYWVLMIGVVVAFALFYVVGLARKQKERRDAREFEGSLGLQARHVEVGKEEIREALAELSQKWEEAVREFREAGMSIYDLPWYLLIGEPQSGKSTTIQNSGLEFPVGTESLSGSGGTRNCDWWFTNEAVILDTAGRFTFQEANAPDQHEWNTFLRLLARHRKLCPINGVVVVIPVTSLVEDPVDVIENKAKNIRQKLRHLQLTLGICFPIFILITKTDRVLGFTEFFSRLDPIDQRQLFGWSTTTSQTTTWNPKEFDQNFNQIVTRVHKLRLKFFHGEGDAAKIDKLFVFPEELAALREPLALYLSSIFSGSRFEEPLMLRGFYFTSGIQQGRPFALACKELLRVRAGDPEGILENLEQVFSKSRAFFIRDFYEKKVFPEQGLVAKTRETIVREKLRKRILFGGIGLTSAILIPLLIWAGTSLRTTVGAITENVHRAEKCLGGEEPCTAKQAYDLIKALEANKTDLQRKWLARWMFLKGKNNPVVVRYIPAAQGALFRERIVGPLHVSFDVRASKIDWAEQRDLYLVFRDALLQLLRFQELANPTIGEVQGEELRAAIGLRPLLEFCARTPGADGGRDGGVIDEWLQTDGNAPVNADQYFAAVVKQFPKVVSENPPLSTRGARDAMLRFWTVDSLAGWDSSLLERHFGDGFLGFASRVDALDLANCVDRAAGVRAFVGLADSFDANWRAAADLMATGRPSAGSSGESPGDSPDQWRSHCLRDFERVLEISDSAFVRQETVSRCDVIPAEYLNLEAEWQRYEPLYLGSPQAEAEERLAWSPNAVAVYNVIAVLRKGLAEPEIQSAHEQLADRLGQGLGIQNQLAEIASVCNREATTLIFPVDSVDALQLPDFDSMARVLRTAAELGVAERVLPPVAEYFFERVFDVGNQSLLSVDRARVNVPAANDFLVWTQLHLGNVDLQPTTAAEIATIDNAVYEYVRELVDLEIASMGGGGGGGSYFIRPLNAERAQSWRSFVDAVSQWTYVGRGGQGESRGSASGIDSKTLADFAQQNARLESLSRELRDAEKRSRSASASSGPVVSPTLERAINDFKSLVSSLHVDALEAWRQLGQRPENLDKFHAFTELGSVRYASDCRKALEEHGAELLSAEITPQFQRAYKEYWRQVEDYGIGYFPFVTRGQLEDARALYHRGYSQSERQASEGKARDSRRTSEDRESSRSRRSAGVASWANRTSDATQRVETIVLELPTVSRRDAEDLFAELGQLIDGFALASILDGSEPSIDFVGRARPTLTSLRGWASYLLGGGSRRRGPEETFEARLLAKSRHGDGTFLLERVNAIDFFDAERPIRSSTEQYVDVPLVMSESPITVRGTNEDRSAGWTGQLVIEGGDFKIPFFVLVAADNEPSVDRRIWQVRIEIPVPAGTSGRIDGIFELSFDRAIPEVLPDNAGREYD